MAWFSIRASVTGSPVHVMQEGVANLCEELAHREYLRDTRVDWDPQSERILVDLRIEAATSDEASGAAYEELFESAMAILGDFEAVKVMIEPLGA
jgi:hypothetical protein